MEELVHDELTIRFIDDDNKVELKWYGRSTHIQPVTILEPFFNEVYEEIDERTLIINFMELEFMNSSTFIPILVFLKKLGVNKVNTEMVYDGGSQWQTSSFKAISTVCHAFPTLSIKGKSRSEA